MMAFVVAGAAQTCHIWFAIRRRVTIQGRVIWS